MTLANPTGDSFCFCPVGDSKGLTARLFYSILHGCIPVRVDSHNRKQTIHTRAFRASPQFDEPARRREFAAPFQSLIEWAAVVVDVNHTEPQGLLRMLDSIPKRDVRRRQRYMANVSRLLLVDGADSALGATAFVHALQSLMLRGDTETFQTARGAVSEVATPSCNSRMAKAHKRCQHNQTAVALPT